jgi:hypothetical protein
MWVKLVTGAALSAALFSVQAQEAKELASTAALADGVSSAVNLVARAAELNPLVPLLSFGMTTAVFRYAGSLPDAEQPTAYAVAASVWQGSAANNLCLTVAFLSGGTFTPVCIALGAAWGMKTWKDSEHERRFWERCAMLREFADRPELECVYTRPDKEPMTAMAMAAWGEIEAP